jgi:lactoylglutathione lyase
MNTSLLSLTPNLVVDDMDATLQFYTHVLDFQLIASVPETGLAEWAMVQRNDVALMFQTRASLAEDMPALSVDKGMAGTFFCKVTDVKEVYEKVRTHALIKVEMRKTFYGMDEFTFMDLNGYYFTFAQEVGE